NLLQDYQDLCNPCPAPFSLTAEVSNASAALSWAEIPDYHTFNLQYRPVGQPNWMIQEGVSSPFVVPVSGICKKYEFSVQAYCQSGQASAWSDPVDFNSVGCCVPPDVLDLQSATATSLHLQWPDQTASDNWVLRYRIVGSSGAWLKTIVDANHAVLTNLHPCTSYEVQIQSECNGAYTAYSPVFKFTTDGCGSCTETIYCAANAGQSSGEWISAVDIGGWLQNSGVGGGGYQNFTGEQYSVLELYPLQAIPVILTPGFFGLTNKEFFRIYIDFNADGDFEDAGELAFDPGYAVSLPIAGLLQTPGFTYAGFSRMRILMKAKNATNGPPAPCESFDFGQIEDYCVKLVPTSATETPDIVGEKLKIYPQPAQAQVTIEWPETAGETTRLEVWNLAGQLVLAQTLPGEQRRVQLSVNNWQSGLYRVNIQTARGIWREKLIKI
ncbi:MAG: GEVED domain-containing protein, partial [Saprospiraceae bacterium]